MADQLPQSPVGLYFPKLGSAYVVSLNGVVIGRDGDLLVSGGQDTGKAPRLMPVNAELIKPHNILRIQLRADSGRKAGVSAVVIDEWGKVSALFDEYRLWRVGVPGAIAAAHACLAVLSVLLWWWSGRGRLDGAGPQPIFFVQCRRIVLLGVAADGFNMGDASLAVATLGRGTGAGAWRLGMLLRARLHGGRQVG